MKPDFGRSWLSFWRSFAPLRSRDLPEIAPWVAIGAMSKLVNIIGPADMARQALAIAEEFREFPIECELTIEAEHLPLIAKTMTVIHKTGRYMVFSGKIDGKIYGKVVSHMKYELCGICHEGITLESVMECAKQCCMDYQWRFCWVPLRFTYFPHPFGEVVHLKCWEELNKITGEIIPKYFQQLDYKETSHSLHALNLMCMLIDRAKGDSICTYLKRMRSFDRQLLIREIFMDLKRQLKAFVEMAGMAFKDIALCKLLGFEPFHGEEQSPLINRMLIEEYIRRELPACFGPHYNSLIRKNFYVEKDPPGVFRIIGLRKDTEPDISSLSKLAKKNYLKQTSKDDMELATRISKFFSTEHTAPLTSEMYRRALDDERNNRYEPVEITKRIFHPIVVAPEEYFAPKEPVPLREGPMPYFPPHPISEENQDKFMRYLGRISKRGRKTKVDECLPEDTSAQCPPESQKAKKKRNRRK